MLFDNLYKCIETYAKWYPLFLFMWTVIIPRLEWCLVAQPKHPQSKHGRARSRRSCFRSVLCSAYMLSFQSGFHDWPIPIQVTKLFDNLVLHQLQSRAPTHVHQAFDARRPGHQCKYHAPVLQASWVHNSRCWQVASWLLSSKLHSHLQRFWHFLRILPWLSSKKTWKINVGFRYSYHFTIQDFYTHTKKDEKSAFGYDFRLNEKILRGENYFF